MPSFSDSLTGLSLDRTITKEELLRAIRFMVAAEYEAVELYEKVHDATKDEKIKKAIMSIINEEKIHAGEFLRMLAYLDPKEVEFYQEGSKETEKFLKSAKKQALADLIRSAVEVDKEGTYVWKKIKKLPGKKVLKYKSPFSGKEFTVSP